MHLIKSLCCAIFVAMVLVSTAFVPVSFADTAAAEFKKVHGLVDVFRSGEKKAVVVGVGATVAVGDIVRTGRRSRAQLQLADGSVMNIGSLTKIQIGEFSFDAERKIRKSSISDFRGKVRAIVSKSTNKDSFFQIKTPGAVAAVRGTDYGVDAVSPSETVVVTYSGAVAVSNLFGPQQNKSVVVRRGQYTRVVAVDAPTTPTAAPANVINNMTSGTQQLSSSSSSGSGGTSSGGTAAGATSGTAAAAPVASGGSGGTATSTSTQTTVPQTAPPTQAATVAPVIAPPPIVLTAPAIQNQNVNIVIQF